MKKSEKTNYKGETNEQINCKDPRERPSWLEFMLVRNMLVALVFLVTLLIILPIVFKHLLKADIIAIIDFSKWILTALLAAFGAWIGAGAAYFFGKENLLASSDSTQRALELQKDSVKTRSRLLDLDPMPLNPTFQFKLDSPVADILEKLGENVDYWFVPIIEDEKFIDTIHTEAFWRYQHKTKDIKTAKVSEVHKFIEDEPELKNKKNKLRGFFMEFKMNDLIEEASDKMNERNASVGIVCDSEGKPTHCFSINDLRSFKLGSS